MAYFHCLIGGGSSGGGYELTVTCDADFAGTTITCTDGVTTLTETCPSSSPYEVVFVIPNGGTWTVSGIVSGSTCTASIDIPDELELIAIPDGSTVTPTDDVQIWLACAGIRDKSYTTLNEVLADSTTLLALMSDDNASDYLVRSTTWASGITADSTAMTDIGANNYCANTLLADSTWLIAIANSTYFENVVNIKIPTMTSNTTPSGECFGSSVLSGFYYFRAFDNISSNDNKWVAQTASNQSIGYDFGSAKRIYYAVLTNESGQYSNQGAKSFKIQDSDDKSTWHDSSAMETAVQSGAKIVILTEPVTNRYWQAYVSDNFGGSYISVDELQFYGRADV